MSNPYSSTKGLPVMQKSLPVSMQSFVIPLSRINSLRKNNIYSGTTDIFTGIIEDKNGVMKHSKSFTDYTSAIMWCRGMISESGSDAYRLTDTLTKICLSSGRMQGKDFVAYSNVPVVEEPKVPGLETPIIPEDFTTALEEGIRVEMEHVKSIPETIAKDHLKEDPNYYSKLAKIEGRE